MFARVLLTIVLLMAGVETVSAESGPAQGVTSDPVVPNHDVRYTRKPVLPQWKLDWDQARKLYHSGRIEQALVQYELLLQRKGTIDEARWEYALILMEEKRWPDAARQLDQLLARQPENRDYLRARAETALQGGDAAQAVRLFGQLYEEDPGGRQGLAALTGLINALGKVGNSEAQLLLLDQLLIRVPDDHSLLMLAGKTALSLKRYTKAASLLSKAVALQPDDPDTLRLLAQCREHLNDLTGAALWWQELVAVHPQDREANLWLSRYYRNNGQISMALVHLERVIAVEPGNHELLLQAARLQRQAGQPGRALDYYNLYLELVPQDRGAIRERQQVRMELASNLLSLAENGGSIQLWNDLGQLTSDRQGVVQVMAELLARKGKQEQRDDLLLVLYCHHPDNQLLGKQLTPLLRSRGGCGPVLLSTEDGKGQQH